jgi:capsular exopolysaccharide synthesis family protein
LREGKTTTASNLGIMMAHAGLKTIVIDVDWKNPTQHLLFNLSNQQGLMDLLISSDIKTEELVRSTTVNRLQILTIGNLPEDPVEVLQPSRIKEILNELVEISDVVILDAPSTNIAESATLYNLVDSVILVIASGRSTTASVRQSMANLHLTGGKLLGGILNQSPSPWGIS